MKKIKATCETNGCPQKDVTHEFVSDIIYTVCGICNQEITNLVIEDVEDGTATETP